MNEDKTFVPCICNNCGASIDYQPGQEAVVCPYCGTTVMIAPTGTRVNVTNNVTNHIQNINETHNDSYNIQVGKKGAVQSAFEYLDKRAAAQEQAAAEERARIRQKEEAAAARKKAFWSGVGKFFLWVYGCPIILPVTIYKRYAEKKENAERIAHGIAPKELSKIPVVFAAIGVLFWLSILGSALSGESETGVSPSNQQTSTSKAVATAAPTAAPEESDATTTNDANWYENEVISLKEVRFSVPTSVKKEGIFQYEVPESWVEDSSSDKNTEYVVAEGNKDVVFRIVTAEDSSIAEDTFEKATDTELNQYLDALVRSVVGDNYNVTQIIPTSINGRRSAVAGLNIKPEGSDKEQKVLMGFVPAKNQVFLAMYILTNSEYSTADDDLCSILNSVQIIEE